MKRAFISSEGALYLSLTMWTVQWIPNIFKTWMKKDEIKMVLLIPLHLFSNVISYFAEHMFNIIYSYKG